jgi:hypothetical protein
MAQGSPGAVSSGGGWPGQPSAQSGASTPRGLRSPRGWIAGGLVALLVVVALVVVNLTGGGKASAAQIQLESTSTSGPSPFGAPVGQDATGVVAPANAKPQEAGNTSGLFAQNPGQPSCDTAALVSQLTGDQTKAAAWAAPLGTSAAGIPDFVKGLNPVTLRADTSVTEYGYSSGQFQPYPAVLQAGTAVLVNSFGEPTVKCFNADPLGQPTKTNSTGKYVGTSWAGFAAKHTVQVIPASAPQTKLVAVNQTTNTTIQITNNIDPNNLPKTNPTPPTGTTGQLLLTGVHNYDGTVTLSDGRVMRPDGSFTKPTVNVTHPAGTVTLPDGGFREPNGLVFNKDGTQRKPIVFAGPPQRTVNPDGTTTPAIAFGFVKFNYDGSFLIIDAGKGGSVKVVDANGNLHPAVPPIPVGSTVSGDGTITTPDGKFLDPNGAQRPPQLQLPGGDVLNPDGSNAPPASQATTPDQVQLNQNNKNIQNLVAPNPSANPNGSEPSVAPSDQSSAQPSGGPASPEPGTSGGTSGTGTSGSSGTGSSGTGSSGTGSTDNGTSAGTGTG